MASDGNYSKKAPPDPFKAYDHARRTLIYRLSELAFGSLLASYVIGFIGFWASLLATHMPVWPSDLGNAAAPGLAYLFISATFARLTATLYISYHTVILARPTIPLVRMRWDFGIALSQAVCFGVSMLLPATFPLCITIAVFLAMLRQRSEYVTFRNQLYDARPKERGVVAADLKDREGFDAAVKKQLARSGVVPLAMWGPPTNWKRWWMFLTASLIVLGAWIAAQFAKSEETCTVFDFWLNVSHAVVSFILMVITVVTTRDVFKNRPYWVSPDGLEELNNKYSILLGELEIPQEQVEDEP